MAGMTVTDRLRRLTGEGEPSADERGKPGRGEQLSELRQRLECILARRPETARTASVRRDPRKNEPALQELLEGCEACNGLGSFFRIESLLEGAETHGSRRLEELASLDMEAVALLANDPRLSAFDSRSALFLDTETTGLAGGTGTLAFLVGVGWFEGDGRFIVRQLFARSFAEEQAVLAALAEIAATKRYLISFNGKAFDVNLLTSRYILNRLDNPLTALPHLDLLHPARRIFSHRVDNSRLATLEEKVLGFRRNGDLPGSEVPLRYFNWLRSRNPNPMLDVFRHNRLDITALAALTVHLAGMLSPEGQSFRYVPTDLCAAARLFLERGRPTEACTLFEGLSRSPSRRAALEARQALSLIYKRGNQWEKAVGLWEAMVEENPGDLFAAEELAKWFEHRARNFERAFQLVESALKSSPSMPEERREVWLHRLFRLQARRERALRPRSEDQVGSEEGEAEKIAG